MANSLIISTPGQPGHFRFVPLVPKRLRWFPAGTLSKKVKCPDTFKVKYLTVIISFFTGTKVSRLFVPLVPALLGLRVRVSLCMPFIGRHNPTAQRSWPKTFAKMELSHVIQIKTSNQRDHRKFAARFSLIRHRQSRQLVRYFQIQKMQLLARYFHRYAPATGQTKLIHFKPSRSQAMIAPWAKLRRKFWKPIYQPMTPGHGSQHSQSKSQTTFATESSKARH